MKALLMLCATAAVVGCSEGAAETSVSRTIRANVDSSGASAILWHKIPRPELSVPLVLRGREGRDKFRQVVGMAWVGHRLYVLDAGSTPHLTVLDSRGMEVVDRVLPSGAWPRETGKPVSVSGRSKGLDHDEVLVLSENTAKLARVNFRRDGSSEVSWDSLALGGVHPTSSFSQITVSSTGAVLLGGMMPDRRAILLDESLQSARAIALAGEAFNREGEALASAGEAVSRASVVGLASERIILASRFRPEWIIIGKNYSSGAGRSWTTDTQPIAVMRTTRKTPKPKLYWRSDAALSFTAVSTNDTMSVLLYCGCPIGSAAQSHYLLLLNEEGDIKSVHRSDRSVAAVALSPSGAELAVASGRQGDQSVLIIPMMSSGASSGAGMHNQP